MSFASRRILTLPRAALGLRAWRARHCRGFNRARESQSQAALSSAQPWTLASSRLRVSALSSPLWECELCPWPWPWPHPWAAVRVAWENMESAAQCRPKGRTPGSSRAPHQIHVDPERVHVILVWKTGSLQMAIKSSRDPAGLRWVLKPMTGQWARRPCDHTGTQRTASDAGKEAGACQQPPEAREKPGGSLPWGLQGVGFREQGKFNRLRGPLTVIGLRHLTAGGCWCRSGGQAVSGALSRAEGPRGRGGATRRAKVRLQLPRPPGGVRLGIRMGVGGGQLGQS